jgi:hypothetical protein
MVLRHAWWLGLVGALVACERHKREDPYVTRIAFGDCAAVTAPFVSGPRPVRREPTRVLATSPPSPGLGAFADLTAPPDGDAASGSSSGSYDPGATSPLRAREAALLDCFRALHQPHGVVVVDLELDASGAVTRATEAGVADPRFASCVEAAAKQVRRRGGGALAERCGVAFGITPVAELPVLEIGEHAVTWRGKPIAKVQEIRDAAGPEIPALSQALAAWSPADANAPLRVNGPGLLEPVDVTPMRVVSRVLFAADAAGTSFALAISRGGAWRPLRDVVAPVVPVPVGSGTSWNAIDIDDSTVDGEDRVELSVVLTPTRIWVGLSRLNESSETTQRDWAELERVLVEHKKSPLFVDRHDIEIAGEDDVSYADVVHTIEIAERAGFAEWSLVQPKDVAAARPRAP